MDFRHIISRENTNALRGIMAVGIFLFHILIHFQPSPLTNFWGGMFVAGFLVLSGFGINESVKRKGLEGFWALRWHHVILPTLIFICLFNVFAPNGSVKTCLEELTYQTPTYWFIFHLLKCYAVYWVGMRFLPRHIVPWMALWALVCLNYPACGSHLESEQALSFLSGVLISRHKGKLIGLPNKKLWQMTLILFGIGLLCFSLKLIPEIRDLRGSVPYHYLQCPFRLTWGLTSLLLMSSCTAQFRPKLLQWTGRHSLEIYVAHIPLLPYITSPDSFLTASVLCIGLFITLTVWVLPQLGITHIIYIGVNTLFIAKYGERVTPDHYLWVVLGMTLLHTLMMGWLLPYLKTGEKWKKSLMATGVLAVLGMLGVQYVVDPAEILVDRWSALHNPISFLLQGEYPYLATTHLGGYASPFPMWQVLHIPFYMLGNVGLSFFAALIFFLWAIRRTWGSHTALCAMLMMATAPAVWYEVSVRSDLITNMLLTCGLIILFLPMMNRYWLEKYSIPIAVGCALLACTRLITLLPLGLLILPAWLHISRKKQILMPAIFLGVFALTFLPFALWEWERFFHSEFSPWMLQARQGNATGFLLYAPLAIALAMQWKENSKAYLRNTAVMLTVFVGVSIGLNMMSNGNFDLFHSAYDITYFSTALPFCIAAIIIPDVCKR